MLTVNDRGSYLVVCGRYGTFFSHLGLGGHSCFFQDKEWFGCRIEKKDLVNFITFLYFNPHLVQGESFSVFRDNLLDVLDFYFKAEAKSAQTT